MQNIWSFIQLHDIVIGGMDYIIDTRYICLQLQLWLTISINAAQRSPYMDYMELTGNVMILCLEY